jgi:hypothetical protein
MCDGTMCPCNLTPEAAERERRAVRYSGGVAACLAGAAGVLGVVLGLIGAGWTVLACAALLWGSWLISDPGRYR